MALGTEAPSTGSQREPSRLEQNTNQRLTDTVTPHTRVAVALQSSSPSLHVSLRTLSRTDEGFDFQLPPGKSWLQQKLKMKGEHVFVPPVLLRQV